MRAGAVDGGLDFVQAGVEGGVGGVFLSFFRDGEGFFDQVGFDVGAAAETPGGAEDFDGVGAFEGVLGLRRSQSWPVSLLYSASSCGRTKLRVEKRWSLQAFWEDAAFPASVRGPVEAWALRRLASSCAVVVGMVVLLG